MHTRAPTQRRRRLPRGVHFGRSNGCTAGMQRRRVVARVVAATLAAATVAAAAAAAAVPAVAAAPAGGAAARQQQQPAWQDEARSAGGMGGGRGIDAAAGAGGMARQGAAVEFQDGAWHATHDLPGRGAPGALYREPFAVEKDADMHTLLDLAHDHVLASWKALDANHDGVLRNTDVRMVMQKVLNPDSAPLTEVEGVHLDKLVGAYLRKQGLVVPGMEDRRAVSREFLHGWHSIFFLRDAAAALRETRAEVTAAAAAARAAAERANANVRLDSGGDEEGDTFRRLLAIQDADAAGAFLAAATKAGDIAAMP